MSEQPPLDQTHGYNERATDAIAAMPKNEQGLPVPNESAYNQSQLILEGDPQAMARSKEMERWSEKAGKYADRAAKAQHNATEQSLSSTGIDEFTVKERMRSAAKVTASEGVLEDKTTHPVPAEGWAAIRPSEKGMTTGAAHNRGFPDFDPKSEDRSPATIAKDSADLQQAVRAAKKTVEQT